MKLPVQVSSVALTVCLLTLTACTGTPTTPAGTIPPPPTTTTTFTPTPTDPTSTATKELEAATVNFNSIFAKGVSSNNVSFGYRSVATGPLLKSMSRGLIENFGNGLKVTATIETSSISVQKLSLTAKPPAATVTACTHQKIVALFSDGSVAKKSDGYFRVTYQFEKQGTRWLANDTTSKPDTNSSCPQS